MKKLLYRDVNIGRAVSRAAEKGPRAGLPSSMVVPKGLNQKVPWRMDYGSWQAGRKNRYSIVEIFGRRSALLKVDVDTASVCLPVRGAAGRLLCTCGLLDLLRTEVIVKILLRNSLMHGS